MSGLASTNRESVESSTTVSTTNTLLPSQRIAEADDAYKRALAEQRVERRKRFQNSFERFRRSCTTPLSQASQSLERTKSPLCAEQDGRRVSQPAPDRPQSPQSSSRKATHPSLKNVVLPPGPSSPLAKQFPVATAPTPDTIESRASRSPSVIPDRMPYQVHAEPSRLDAQPLDLDTSDIRQTLPRVTNTPSVPHTPITPSKLSLHQQVSLSPDDSVLDICNLTAREHAISLSMHGRIRKQYCMTIKHFASSIRRFFEESPCRSETIIEINKMLAEVSKVTTHMDLQGSGPASQGNVDAKFEADYAESCSEKFVFLGHLIERMRNMKINLYIAAKGGPLLSVIETYLKARGVPWTRFHENGNYPVARKENELLAFLIPSDQDHNTHNLHWPEPDAIIGFDETFSINSVTNFHRSSYPPPILRPMVFASLEHIDLCVPRNMNQIERLRRIVFVLLQTQRRVGSFHEPSSKTCADYIATSVHSHSIKRPDRGWPLPPIPAIEDVSIMIDSDPSLFDTPDDTSGPEGSLRYWPNLLPSTVRPASVDSGKLNNGKRPFDLEWGEPAATQMKKLRMGSHYCRDFEGIEPDESQASLLERLENASERINVLEEHLAKKTSLSDDLMLSANLRQYEFERLRKENGDLRISQKETAIELLKVQDRLAKNDQLNTSLLAAKDKLQNLNNDLQAQLTSHPEASIAAAARSAAQLESLQSQKASLEKKFSSLSADFDFTRQQYQLASTSAADLASEISSLRSQNTALQRQVDHNIAEYRRLGEEDMNQELRKEVDRLKAMLKQRDWQCQKLEADVADLKRGRAGMQTRGSSQQPRSPRQGGGGGGGGGSRGVSPAAGLLGGVAMSRGGSGLGGSSRFAG